MNKPCRLGIISDTHLTELGPALEFAATLIAGVFSDVDAILHAGDMVVPEFETCFGDIPLYSVQGNMDQGRADLPIKRIITLARRRIGLIHGWGAPANVPLNVMSEFTRERLDLLVFGHSHTPFNAVVEGTLLFNPGSALDHRGHATACSVGLIELGDQISARHIYLDRG